MKKRRNSPATCFLEDRIPVREMMREVEHNGRRVAGDETGERDQRVLPRQASAHQNENPQRYVKRESQL